MLEVLEGKKTFAVIKAVYENGHSGEEFERELDRALVSGIALVIIEPEALGEATWRWISWGNRLHKTSVLAGLASLSLRGLQNRSIPTIHPGIDHWLSWSTVCFGCFSVSCAFIYSISWQSDPCSKYQVERNWKVLRDTLPYSQLTSISPVVLIRKDDIYRRYLHNAIALSVLCTFGYKLFRNSNT